MEPIKNSPVKEAIRLKNQQEAYSLASQRCNEIDQKKWDLSKQRKKPVREGTYFLITVVLIIVLCIAMRSPAGILVGIIMGIVVAVVHSGSQKSSNNNLEKQQADLEALKKSESDRIHAEADAKTRREIAAYEADVKAIASRVLSKPENYTEMINHQIEMLRRMVSHADHSSNRRFVEADLIYTVMRDGIHYAYQSGYSCKLDDFNFSQKRYRDLSTDAECEGFAFALAKMTMVRVKKLAKANSVNLSVDHTDATVTIHYKAANKQFVPARDIL